VSENELALLTDTPEADAERKSTLKMPTQVRLIIDTSGAWTEHSCGQSSRTTIGEELERLRSEGWSLWGIFMEGMHYLSRVHDAYLWIDAWQVFDHEKERGHWSRSEDLVRRGITPTQIYLTGIAQLAGPPPTKEQLALVRLLASGTTNEDIYLAGLRALVPELEDAPEVH
jgi:hypothetical protein